jgi:hypothetical protein
MSTSDPKPSLEQLAEGVTQTILEQQTRAAEQSARQAAPKKGNLVLAIVLMVACVGMLAYQAPRIATPYEWPDADSSPMVADADLEAVVSLIETYRLSQGRYPAALSDIRLPQGLSEVVAGSELAYRPAGAGYVLDWTLPHWHATYSSETGQANVQPRAKP